MVTGFCTVPEDSPEEIYDYCGCLFPEGVISSDEIYVFNHSQIQDVLFIGYEDDETKTFHNNLIDMVKNIKKGDNPISTPDSSKVISDDYEEIERL